MEPTIHSGRVQFIFEELAMAFAELLNAEASALEVDGVDVIQIDETRRSAIGRDRDAPGSPAGRGFQPNRQLHRSRKLLPLVGTETDSASPSTVNSIVRGMNYGSALTLEMTGGQ